MSDISIFNTLSGAGTTPLKSLVDHAIREPGSQAGLRGPAGQSAKIEKSARDFESILLGSWLQQAEQTFATLPGGEDDEDADAGKDQFQGMAMQSLGSSMTAAGGIGIGKMIAKQLHRVEDARVTTEAAVEPHPARSD